jgi:hypothetical protein
MAVSSEKHPIQMGNSKKFGKGGSSLIGFRFVVNGSLFGKWVGGWAFGNSKKVKKKGVWKTPVCGFMVSGNRKALKKHSGKLSVRGL